jgi:hypothetical protein
MSDPDPAAELRDARTELADVVSEIEDVGEQNVEAVADAYDRATDLLDGNEEAATGTGDFEAYVRFQNAFVELVEELDDDLPTRDAFETANEHLDKRRLSESDFDRGRETLAPAREIAALLDRRESARERVHEAEYAVESRIDELDDRIDELERLEALDDVDLDVPVTDLRDRVDAYNDAVRDAFASFRSTASARTVFELVEATAAYPLVEYRQPPSDLRTYVAERPAGEETIETLLEYADYSASKLDHYVEDPSALKTRVAVHRTYLERLDADPLTVSWPPADAPSLRRRLREIEAVLHRFAPEETVTALRSLRDLTRTDRYERLREAAVVETELDERQRERLRSGAIHDELATARSERERLVAALEA